MVGQAGLMGADIILKEKREELEEQAKSYKATDGVNLSTLHSSKGLEYDTVFLVDVNEKSTCQIKKDSAGCRFGRRTQNVLRRNDARPERADALLCGGTV